ncbi:4-hydroxybutyrate CoA-transferase [Metallumcola ferriviriculae]|uniref:4-hydroxybutyrate CoA-transferase n=1 Tax=Metallumcola ferriviriculae TaxID=3039180 RepID=A0AAU0UP10_9FIRM|nr:4-hydroxybutyrate CoA-transferase [Desulfitibacteraceae bacterium MK1]
MNKPTNRTSRQEAKAFVKWPRPLSAQSASESYRKKLVSPEEAVTVIKSADRVALAMGCGEPPALLTALYQRHNQVEDVILDQMLPFRKAEYLNAECAPHIRHNSWFTSGHNRQGINEGWSDYTPGYFHEYPKYFEKYVAVDVFMGTVSPMDDQGYFSFGVSVDYTSTAAAEAKIVILEVNETMPRTHGNSLIHISEVDFVIEHNYPIPELPNAPLTEKDIKIGQLVAERIEDASTIQLGIGAMPNAVGKALVVKKNLGIHSEMLTDGMVYLVESGAVTNRKKTIHQGKIIGTFAGGSRRLYDFLDHNPDVEMHPVSYVNDPYVIGQNYKMVSINATIEVDLFGQCASESIGTYHFSGTGGQTDFARGCVRSPGGKGFIVLHSTAKGGAVSKIVSTLKPGAIVTTTKNDVDHVVTEYGVAALRGKSAQQRAVALINIAHPDYREELTFQAKKINLI